MNKLRLKLIKKQKKQNEELKSQVRELSDEVDRKLKKVQKKLKEEDKKVPQNSEVIRKELQNEMKKNSIIQKELFNMKYRFEYLQGDKIDTLKNEIRDKDRKIAELEENNKMLEKENKLSSSSKREQDLEQKVKIQNEEVIHLKKKVQEQKKKEEDLESRLDVLRKKVDELKMKSSAKPIQKQVKQHNDEKTVPFQDFEKLQQKFKQLENSKKLNDKNNRHQIEVLNQRINQMERQLTQKREEVLRKEKEINIILFKLKEGERKKFNTLEPIKTARYSEEVLHSSGSLFQTRKISGGLSWGQGIYRDFDDSSNLPHEKNYRIKKIVFTFFEEHILSLTVNYDIIQGDFGKYHKKQTKTLDSFCIPSQYANIQTSEHQFGDYQYITSMQIYSGKSIEYIQITTSKEHILEAGNFKIITKCKKHVFQIGTHEKPISFMGVIESRKIGGEPRQFLVNIGLELRRKEVFIRDKNRRFDALLNRSLHSKSKNDNNE